MIDLKRLSMIVVAVGCVAGGGAASSAGTYTDEQMELAGKLGSAVALSRICSGTVPTTAVARVLEASGLTEQDVLGETPIRERMHKQASAVMFANNLQKESGETQEEIVQEACHSFRANFGPDGILLRGVAD